MENIEIQPSETIFDLSELIVRPATYTEEDRWDQLMTHYHYLGFRTIVGAGLKYIALLAGKPVAALGWGSPVFKSAPRDRWIGWSEEVRSQRRKYLANNLRFLILPGVKIPNLASKVLAANLKRLSTDWQKTYGHPIVLVETFVDKSRYAGTCYLASGWKEIGTTQGFGKKAGRYYVHGQIKGIFIRPLHRKAESLLRAIFPSPQLVGKKIINLNKLNIKGKDGLFSRLELLTDPRETKGLRHGLYSILALIICATLQGNKNIYTIEAWGKQLTQEALKFLRCRFHEDRHTYIPPSDTTILRTLHAVDNPRLNQLIAGWLKDESHPRELRAFRKAVHTAQRTVVERLLPAVFG